MCFKPNYVIIPAITIIVALLGGYITEMNMDWYYNVLIKPDLTPPEWVFPIAWNIIFLFTTISILIDWNVGKEKEMNFLGFLKNSSPIFCWIIVLFIINAILNISFNLLFFGLHDILAGFIDSILLQINLIILIFLVWKISKTASLLLLPYTLWNIFALYLMYQILLLN